MKVKIKPLIPSHLTYVVIQLQNRYRDQRPSYSQESCDTFSSAAGADEQATFINVYATPVASRLNGIVPEFNWTATDVYAAQSLCGYETVIRNESSWCSVFGEDEWLGYEYGTQMQPYDRLDIYG